MDVTSSSLSSLTFDEIHSSSLMHWQLPQHPGSLFTGGIAELLLKISPLPTCYSSLELWDQTAGARERGSAALRVSEGLNRLNDHRQPLSSIEPSVDVQPSNLSGHTGQTVESSMERRHF